MFTESDLKQIKNLVLSFVKSKGYFPFVEDLMKTYSMFFPQDLTPEEKNQINDLVNEIILEWLNSKKTKWSMILWKIFERNENLWKEFRALNNETNFDEEKFQKLGKQMEQLIMAWEDKLTEKLVWARSMWIQKASDAWYNMVYAIFPLWNKIR